jgi:PhoD-like phosphatase/RTX calcium-binding nonapeptide repeat (4 copies)
LDTRSFRDIDLEGPSDITNPAEIARVLTQSLTLDRTLLGKAQLADLKQDLLNAQANDVTWKFVMVPEPIQNIFPGINTDAYEGYGKERTEILKFVNDNNISNVVFIAADVHTTFVNNLTYQEVPFGPQIATSVFEITTGAVAYEQPTGAFLGNLFTATNPALKAFYDSLPIAPDLDNLPNDKDDFVKQAVNDTLLKPLGFDPLGLDDNLPQANGLIDAKLLKGDYFVGHSYSWSEFDIDPLTQKLTVTTYGINGYTEKELLANPSAIANLQPTILSQFEVNPSGTLNGTAGDDTLTGGIANERIFGKDGDDFLYGGAGNDTLDAGAGYNFMDGGEGRDTFVLSNKEAFDWIGNFELGSDAIRLTGGLSFAQLSIAQGSVNDTFLTNTTTGNLVAVLEGIQANALTAASFV